MINWQNVKLTAMINAYSALNIPLLAFITPRVLELSEARAVVRVRLDRRSRNHLGVMYFGALAMGAELSIALQALDSIQKSRQRIDFIFKNFSCEFLKRADGHVHFVCEQTGSVKALIEEAAQNSNRLEKTFQGRAIVPSQGDGPVMKYQLTLSVKNRSRT